LFAFLLKNHAIKLKNRKLEPLSPSYIKNEFMSRMVMLKDKIKLDHMKHSIFSVVGAGYETTGNATAHCILFLALHPEVQEKAFQEIMTVFPTDDTLVDNHSLSQLEYVDRVIKESLRLAPPAPNIGREALENFELSPGRISKKGTYFCIDIFGLHRRKDLWGEDANEFNPDRFEDSSSKQQFYIPFSRGKRNCIGGIYASASFKILIMKLLRSFKFSSELKFDEIKFNRQIALKLVGPHSVNVEKRR
jgi:cytochrome P450